MYTKTFAGRPAPASSPLVRTLEDCVAQPCSVSWWGPSVLGISDAAGTVALAQLPGYLNVLGAEPVQCSRGGVWSALPRERACFFVGFIILECWYV